MVLWTYHVSYSHINLHSHCSCKSLEYSTEYGSVLEHLVRFLC